MSNTIMLDIRRIFCIFGNHTWRRNLSDYNGMLVRVDYCGACTQLKNTQDIVDQVLKINEMSEFEKEMRKLADAEVYSGE